MSVWCVFAVDNNYHDQPNNDLAALWLEKPSIEVLAKFMALPLGNAKDEDIVNIVTMWQGGNVLIRGITYRLEAVEPQKII